MGLLRTQAVLDIEEQTGKDIEDFCDDDYFRETYGDDWCDEHEKEFEDDQFNNFVVGSALQVR